MCLKLIMCVRVLLNRVVCCTGPATNRYGCAKEARHPASLVTGVAVREGCARVRVLFGCSCNTESITVLGEGLGLKEKNPPQRVWDSLEAAGLAELGRKFSCSFKGKRETEKCLLQASVLSDKCSLQSPQGVNWIFTFSPVLIAKGAIHSICL